MTTATREGRNAEVDAVRAAPLDDGRMLRIRGEEVWVGELSLDQFVALIHYARKLAEVVDVSMLWQVIAIGDRVAAAQAEKDEEQINRANLQSVKVIIDIAATILTREQIGDLVGILCDRDADWARKLTLRQVTQILDATMEFNDLRELLAVFRRAWQGWLPRRSSDATSAPSSG